MVAAASEQAVGISSRESREIAIAEGAILVTLSAARNPRRIELCSDQSKGCLGDPQAELALALIASRSSPDSLRCLASLARYKLDGGLSSDWTGYVLNKGKTIKPLLKEFNEGRLSTQCIREVKRLTYANQGKFDDSLAGRVCASTEEMKARISASLDAIRAGKKCGRDDF